MRNKIILLKLFLLITICIPAHWALAQDTVVTDTARKNVQLLYQKFPTKLTAASTASVYTGDLIKSQVTNVYNAIAGRLPGIVVNQSSGMPSPDGLSGVSLSLRGRQPLVLIDGIPRTLLSISLEDIESVTVLKDALSTAMLGVRGANGALLITTRKGSPKEQAISFTAQSGIQQPMGMPKPLDAYNYALLRNEAVDNELRVHPTTNERLYPNFTGASLKYTPADLQAYQDGSDPIGRPNVNWKDEVLRKNSKFNRYSLNATGGNNFAGFFVALEHLSQQGIFKTVDENPYNTNNGVKSYMARANIDINIKPNLTAGISLMGRVLEGNGPGVSFTASQTSNDDLTTNATNNTASNLYSSIWSTPNGAYPVRNANGSFGGNNSYKNNILAQSIGAGYRTTYARDLMSDIYLKRTLNEIIQGLYIKARASYSANVMEDINRSKPFLVYQTQTATDGTVTYTPYNTAGGQYNSNSIRNQGRGDYLELSLGYNTIVNSDHGLDALLLVNRDNTVIGAELPYTVSGGAGKFSYNYQSKYVAEFAFAVNGSNRYEGGKANYGFFPSVGLGWNLEKENFMSNISWVNELKLSASYGVTGWDNPGYYAYIKQYRQFGSNAYFGGGTGFGSSSELMNNPNITWEKSNKFNIGLQGGLLNNKLGFNIEYYNNKATDLLMQRGRTIAFFGNDYPNENIGRNNYSGVDLQLSWQQKIGKDLNFFIAANAGIQKSEVRYMDEAYNPYSWMNRTGQPVGQSFGYTAVGLFQTQAEIDNGGISGINDGKAATFVGYKPQPGDIRYKDLNNDGYINQLDQSAIGTTKPLIAGGVNLGLSFKSFDFSALLQGVANRFIDMRGSAYHEFQITNDAVGQAYESHLDRWTPENTNASYPRLGIGSNVNNHQPFSTYWFKSADYLRLKNVEIGYALPGSALRIVKLKSVRVFANGLNLFTASKLEDGIDPEVNGTAYPIQKIFNFGLNIKL
ncbi:MAG: SusC/RagA family TonB-linked outer membrane protein [Sphingobacteriaceae bacterium]|nr:SusC/RagA family TonB-linked outer membrane protein [Sphingobacteriaceae bacterium]